jgi:hypothetical protein
MASGTTTTMLRLWDAGTGRPVIPDGLRDAPEDEVEGVAVSPDGKWLLTKDGETGAIRVWGSGGQPKGVIRSNRWGGRYPIFSADGRHLFGVAPDAIAMVRWDFPAGKESARYTFAEPATDQVYVYHFGLSANGRRLAAITQTGPFGPKLATLTVWDAATAQRLETRTIEGQSYLGYGAFAPDLRWYFLGDRGLSVGGGPELPLELPKEWSARQAAVSPDGRLVAQAAEEQVKDLVNGQPSYRQESRGVVVHEAATGRRVLTLPTGFCGLLAFTPGGRGLVVADPGAITRWDLATREPVVRHRSPGRFVGSYGRAFASSLTLTPDGTRAVTGHIDTTALVWNLPPPARRVTTLSDRDLAAAWADLAGADAGKAFAAVWALADAGEGAVPYLRDRLRPAAAPPDGRVRELVARLDADAFADREAAGRELRALGEAAAPALRAAVRAGLSAEQTRRVTELLAAADAPTLAPGDRLRAVRAVAALELIGTGEARELLGRLAGGLADARLTREAKAAVERLGRQPR